MTHDSVSYCDNELAKFLSIANKHSMVINPKREWGVELGTNPASGDGDAMAWDIPLTCYKIKAFNQLPILTEMPSEVTISLSQLSPFSLALFL